MNDDDLDLLVASASPVSDRRVAALPLDGPEAELLEAIMSLPRPHQGALPEVHPRYRRWRLQVLAPVAALVALVVGVVGFQQLGGDRNEAWAAPVVAVANAAPRILVQRPGWSVTRADEFTAAIGEMTYGDGRNELELRWQPAGDTPDRSKEAAHLETLELMGRDARLFRYNGPVGPTVVPADMTITASPPATASAVDGPGDFTTLWSQGPHSVEVRGVFADIETYKSVLAGLREVDVDTWLRAMPASVVRPDDRSALVDEMLADVPVPEGFDTAALRAAEGVKDRYQLGAAVAGSAACAWIDSWVGAIDAGDDGAAQRAVDAMATSHRWSVLAEMRDQGAYPDVVWELADAMATDAPVSGGKPVTIRDSYVNTLGCAPR